MEERVVRHVGLSYGNGNDLIQMYLLVVKDWKPSFKVLRADEQPNGVIDYYIFFIFLSLLEMQFKLS